MKPLVEAIIPAWMYSAACVEIPGDLWYPEKGSNQYIANVKAVCNARPVKRQCLDHAISHDEHDGIWGGLTARQRRKLAREREQEAA